MNTIDAQIPLLLVSALPGFHHQGLLVLTAAALPNWSNVTNTDAHPLVQFNKHRRTPTGAM